MTDFVFNKFSDVENTTLRTFNRVMFMENIKEDFGTDKVREYIELFNEPERKQMYIMVTFIKKNGVEAAQSIVRRIMSEEN